MILLEFFCLFFTILKVVFIKEDPGKESACNAVDTGDVGSVPGSERSPGGGNGNPFQYSCWENLMHREASSVTVWGVAKSRTWLSTHTNCGRQHQRNNCLWKVVAGIICKGTWNTPYHNRGLDYMGEGICQNSSSNNVRFMHFTL